VIERGAFVVADGADVVPPSSLTPSAFALHLCKKLKISVQ